MKAGKLSELILNRSVLKKIRNKRKEVLCGAKTGNDAVILRTDGDLTAACAASSSFFYIPEDFTDSEACLASVLLNAELVLLKQQVFHFHKQQTVYLQSGENHLL